jgi:formylglycine-generating enzyme required for sulfatase activity
MSPEQADGKAVDSRSDLFSLGSVLYALCTGHAPFRATTLVAVIKRVIEDTPRPIREINPDIPDRLEAIIAKLHAKNPDDRFQTAKEVADLLENRLAHVQQAGLAPETAPAPRPEIVPDRQKRVHSLLFTVLLMMGPIFLIPIVMAAMLAEVLSRTILVLAMIAAGAMTLTGLILFFVRVSGQPAKVPQGQSDSPELPSRRRSVGDISSTRADTPRRSRAGLWVALVVVCLLLLCGGIPVAGIVGYWGHEKYLGRCQNNLDLSGQPVLKKDEDGPPAWVGEPQVNAADGWVSLFNGKDVPGTPTVRAENWHIKDRVLVGTGDAGLMLRKNLQDFHCRIEAKVVVRGMANVDFRTTWSPAMISGQAVLESRFAKNRTGTLAFYMEPKAGQVLVASPKPPSSPDGWFTIEIIAEGKKATIKVDGATTAERTIPELPDRGDLVLSIVDKGAVIHFRKIEIKELPAAKAGASPQPVLLKSFDPAKEKAVPPQWADAKKAVTVENGAWRIENDTDKGNFNVMLADVFDGIPNSGVLICRAKVKLQSKHKATWGDLMLGDGSPSLCGYDWPPHLAEYRGDVPEWTTKEVRYPVEVFRKKEPIHVPIYVGLHANGVLWVKDLELRHLPAAPKTAPSPAVAPFNATQAKEHQEAWAKHLGVDVEITNSVGMRLRLIPPGEFTMGTSREERDQIVGELNADWQKQSVATEELSRRVKVAAPFYLGECEVTVQSFREFVTATKYRTTAETNGKGGRRHVGAGKIEERPEWVWSHADFAKSDDRPVVEVSLKDAEAFCAWLSKKEGRRYVVPDERQWEYACRAGTATRWWTGDDERDISRVAWTLTNSAGDSHAVGGKPGNPFGLRDMHGNVEEVCTIEGGGAVARRGPYGSPPLMCRSATRFPIPDEEVWAARGFRVAIVGDLKPKQKNDRPQPADPVRPPVDPK